MAPKEYSSGQTRRIGRISKRGDHYLRTLLVHGARAVIAHAQRAVQNGQSVDALRRWALSVRQRRNQNKATCALANKLARICYAVMRDHEPYAVAPRLPYKLARTSFVLAH
ncbi:transposase [Steroidobacter cummioxidans]|uniref:transposase n=1 Tax=Steroidobacter cummioxidans TaxID=1803913 RepID=UPI0032E3D82A